MTPDDQHLGVSKNRDYPKSSISIGFSIIFTIHFGVPFFLETPTPPKFNMEAENQWFPKGLSFSRDLFSGSMLNFGGVL